MQFHQNLKRYRLELGFTQKAMAQQLGISERGYRYYEMGTREPNLSSLVKIADFLGLSLDDLVGRNNTQSPLVDSE